VDQFAFGTIGARWSERSRRYKLSLLGLVVAAACLLPAAGSFVPRESGNLLFGGKAEAACKYGLSNHFTRWYGSGSVVTNWCYDGRSVTSRHSTPYADSASSPDEGGWRVSFSWALSACYNFNGIHNHNCLTQGQFKFYSFVFGYKYVCVHTRIYGNGNHVRRITDGLCPANTLGRRS
jgi:hypothetical protein